MGLFQDQTSSLSELKRLAALVTDPSRRDEIGADQWPLAMIAYGLLTCNQPDREDESITIYKIFQSHCSPETRCRVIAQLSTFIRQRKGDGWRALLPFVLADELAEIRKQASFLIITLAAPGNDERFAGLAALLTLIKNDPRDGQETSGPVLETILSMGDARFAPYLQTLSDHLSPDKLNDLLSRIAPHPSDYACSWLLSLPEKDSALRPGVLCTLEAMPRRSKEVTDVVIPIPSWKFTDSSVQALHAWTLPEYWLRMKTRLSTLMTDEDMQRLEEAWNG